MKVFVWESVSECTGNYHSGGGIVVFAKDEEEARRLANSQPGCNLSDDEKPDEVREVTGGESAIYIMPDAGCC